jgi:hypothetical protein
MPVSVKLGRLPAVEDDRVPLMADLLAAAPVALPAPPAMVNNYAGVGEWGMLANDTIGDCVEACTGHAVLQFTTYADAPTTPTDEDAIALYSAVTGYVPGDDATDQGTVIFGQGGLVEYWAKHGVSFGGISSKAAAFAQIKLANGGIERIQQSIYLFGGVMLGLDLPENVVARDTVPYVWDNPSGPIAGGHCVWLCGYETIAGTLRFDLISWGARYRMTEAFLTGTFQEAVVVFDKDSLNAAGKNPIDLGGPKLRAAMAELTSA